MVFFTRRTAIGDGAFPCRIPTLGEITYRKANAPAPGQDLAGSKKDTEVRASASYTPTQRLGSERVQTKAAPKA